MDKKQPERKGFYERFWWLPSFISAFAALISAIAVLHVVR